MAVGETYVLLDKQSYPGVDQIINRYYYQQIEGTGNSAESLVDKFIDTMLPALTAIQSLQLTHTLIEVYNLDDPSDFYQSAPEGGDGVGVVTGEYLPGFMTWTFKLHRPFRSFRSGRKAISGLSEGAITNSGPATSILAALNTMAEALVLTLTDTATGASFAPALVKNPDQPLPIREVGQILEATFSRISTQNTRKS